MANVKADMTELNNILRCIKKDYTLRIGILGNDADEQHGEDSGLKNVEVGTFHEFGTNKMPRRSFLEDPLKEKLSFSNSNIKPLKKVLWKQFFVKNAPEKFFRDLGSKARDIIEEAFNTNGFGRWKQLSTARAKEKQRKNLSSHILTDTTQLRHSISFTVIKK